MSEEYQCPLCCGEKFDSREALRYHLLSMSVNLNCPKCNLLCENGFSQLADHLAKDCGEEQDEDDMNEETLEQETLESGPEEEILKNMKQDPHSNENSQEATEAAAEIEDVEMLNDTLNENNAVVTLEDGSTIMVTAIDAEEPAEQILGDAGSAEADGEEGEIYSCSSCGVNFTSIMEHIERYHDGQEVVVEVTENNDDENAETILPESILEDETAATAILDESLKHELSRSEYFDEDIIDTTDSEEVDAETNYPQILNTVRQEDCIDKDGRIYTRKVVQIEKFWDEKNVSKEDPVCEYYLINNDGSMKKIDKAEVPVEDDTENVMKIYSCQRCQTQFSKINQFNNHNCDPTAASTYKCSRCEASFNNPKSLCAHMKAHKMAKLATGESSQPVPPFLCNKCDTVFPTNKSLRLHQRMHEPIKAKEIEAPVDYGITGPMEHDPHKPREMFVCAVCNKTYDKGYEAIHMVTHSGDVDYHCDTCNRKFYTHDNLEMHMRVHNGGKPFSCSYCKSSFDTTELLTEHMEVHTKDRPYSCGYCGRKFARPHEKVKHERIHTGEKPHECEICGKTFRVSYCLTLHMRTHTGARPYVCKHCGKRFKAHSVYNHHLLTHSDQRNYQCPYCPKAFKTGVQLAGHKNSHTKPFSCTECNRPFASLYAVRSHMESHKRENNLKFSCYLCGASYARNFALRDHIRDVHNTTPVVITSENGNVIMSGDVVKIEQIDKFQGNNTILAEEDETEIALNTLRTEETDEDL